MLDSCEPTKAPQTRSLSYLGEQVVGAGLPDTRVAAPTHVRAGHAHAAVHLRSERDVRNAHKPWGEAFQRRTVVRGAVRRWLCAEAMCAVPTCTPLYSSGSSQTVPCAAMTGSRLLLVAGPTVGPEAAVWLARPEGSRGTSLAHWLQVLLPICRCWQGARRNDHRFRAACYLHMAAA